VRVFDSLLVLFVIVVILGVVAWTLQGRRETPRKRTPVRYRRPSRFLKRPLVALTLGALVFLVLAFTQFRFLREEGSAGTVVLAMDVSESMSRTDVDPNRLEAAKEAALVFLDRLPSDLQVGLVTFAAQADVVVAPTPTRELVVTGLNDLPRGEGTVLGDGLDAALNTIEAELDGSGDPSAAVVVLSDGRDCSLAPSQCPPGATESLVLPADAAARAADLGVNVHTVLLGPDSSSERAAEAFALLKEIADTTGGSAYTADTASGLIEVYEALETEISTELAISDYGAIFVGIAAVFAIAATVLILFMLRSEN
jgi:Ca-activated chloride channel family protein